MKYLIANWKGNKNLSSTEQWFNDFLSYDIEKFNNRVHIIICPPYPLLIPAQNAIKDIPYISIGAQDISQFEHGPYTGEVVGETLSGIVSHTIIGHSERRKHFDENDSILFKKAKNALKNNITPLYCIRDSLEKYPDSVNFIVYEPPESISTGDGNGNTAQIDTVINIRTQLKLNSDQKFIYGGSVNENNAHEFAHHELIDGLLSGGASLDPQSFYNIACQF